MRLVLFTKMFPQTSAADLCRLANAIGINGYDLCVRDGCLVSPQNVEIELPKLVKTLAAGGVDVPMVTGPGDLVAPEGSAPERMMAAMGATGVKLFKLGYQFYHPRSGSYQNAFDQLQRRLFGWQRLAEKHGVAVCYHTHCGMDGFALGHHMGCNAAALAHLLQDIDPRLMGAYLDPGNMSLSGESFAFGAHIARNWLMAVGLQDVYVTREANADEGGYRRHWVSAGQGAVPWSNVFDTLREIEFQGLLPIHAEYEHVEIQDIESSLKQEVDYFRRKIQCQQQPMNKTEKPA